MQDIPSVSISIDGQSISFDLDDSELPDAIAENAFSSGEYPYEKKLKRKKYEATLGALQLELVKLQAWQLKTENRIVVVFEGRDAAGKSGGIRAIRENLNPRHARVVALPKPSDRQQGQLYYQRYVEHLPSHGEMTIFDRSWYNRAGVEPVMGFCTPEQHKRFLSETPDFEELLVNDGIRLFKFWLNVGQEMQILRFHKRRQNPLKKWKLSPIDIKALGKWDDYTQARNIMLERTHSEHAPWTIVRSNDKRRARINIVRHLLSAIDYDGKDASVIGETDDLILGSGPEFLNKAGA